MKILKKGKGKSILAFLLVLSIIVGTIPANMTAYAENENSGTTSVEVHKTWDDDSNKAGKRPGSITVRLDPTGQTKVLSNSNGWSTTFSGLPVNDSNGNGITYTVTEENIPADYVSRIDTERIQTSSGSATTTKTETRDFWVPATQFQAGKEYIFTTGKSTGDLVLSDNNGTATVKQQTVKFADNALTTTSGQKFSDYITGEDAAALTKWKAESSSTSGYYLLKSQTSGKYLQSCEYALQASTKIAWKYDVPNYTIVDSTGSYLGLYGYFSTRPSVCGYIYEKVQATVQITETVENPSYKWKCELTNTYVPPTEEKTSVDVHKTWDDNDNSAGKRPSSVTVKLTQTGQTKVLSNSNNWKASFTDLPAKDADGNTIKYTVTEENVPDKYINSIEMQRTSSTTGSSTVAGTETKTVWIPATRFESGKEYIITAGRSTGNSLLIDNNGYATMNAAVQTVKFADKILTTTGGQVLSNYITDENAAAYTKWQAVTSSSSGYYYLKSQNSGKYLQSTEYNLQSGATYKWVYSEPKYTLLNSSGTYLSTYGNFATSPNVCVYLYEKAQVTVNTTEVVPGTTTSKWNCEITNTYVEPTDNKTSVEVHKTWNDNNNAAGKRPASITVRLNQTGDTKILSSSNNWSATFTDLPSVDSSGKTINYTVTEVNAPANYSGKVEMKKTVSSTSGTTTTSTEAKSIWVPATSLESGKEYIITAGRSTGNSLLIDNNGYATMDAGIQTVKFADNILTTSGGQQITNYITEEDASAYTKWQAVASTSSGYNYLKSQKSGKYLMSTEYNLQSSPYYKWVYSEPKYTLLNSSGQYFSTYGSFASSPKVCVYLYEKAQVNVNKTETTPGTVTDKWVCELTNTYIEPSDKITSVEVHKTWSDDNNKAGKRPGSITVKLDQTGQTQVLSSSNNWSATFSNLPAEDSNGKTINYTVSELNVPAGYSGKVEMNKTSSTTPPKTTTRTEERTIWVPSGGFQNGKEYIVTAGRSTGNSLLMDNNGYATMSAYVQTVKFADEALTTTGGQSITNYITETDAALYTKWKAEASSNSNYFYLKSQTSGKYLQSTEYNLQTGKNFSWRYDVPQYTLIDSTGMYMGTYGYFASKPTVCVYLYEKATVSVEVTETTPGISVDKWNCELTNTYTVTPPEAEVVAQKTLDNKEPGAANIFHFELYDSTKTRKLSEADNTADGKIVFPYKIKEEGTYWIREVKDTAGHPDIEFDEEWKKVEVTFEEVEEIVDGELYIADTQIGQNYIYIRLSDGSRQDAYCINESRGYPSGESYEMIVDPTQSELEYKGASSVIESNIYGTQLLPNMKKIVYYLNNNSELTVGDTKITLTQATKQYLMWTATGSSNYPMNTKLVEGGMITEVTHEDALNEILRISNPPADYKLVLGLDSEQGAKKQPILSGYGAKTKITYEGTVSKPFFENKIKEEEKPSVQITAKKTLDNKEPGAGNIFKFELYDSTKTRKISEASNTTDGHIVFPDKITEPGTYWIREVKDNVNYPDIEFDETWKKVEVTQSAEAEINDGGRYYVNTYNASEGDGFAYNIYATNVIKKAYGINESEGNPNFTYYTVIVDPSQAELEKEDNPNSIFSSEDVIQANRYGSQLVPNLKKLVYFLDNNSVMTVNGKTIQLTDRNKQRLMWTACGSDYIDANIYNGETSTGVTYRAALDQIFQTTDIPSGYKLILAKDTNFVSQPVIAGSGSTMSVTYEGNKPSAVIENKTKEETKGQFILEKVDGMTGKTPKSDLSQFKFTLTDSKGTGVTGHINESLGSDGRIIYTDLPLGEYILKETNAPGAYAIIKQDIRIRVQEGSITVLEPSPTNGDYISLRTVNRGAQGDSAAASIPTGIQSINVLTVKNYQWIKIPEAGSRNLIYVWAAGIMLLIAGTLLNILTRRKEKGITD